MVSHCDQDLTDSVAPSFLPLRRKHVLLVDHLRQTNIISRSFPHLWQSSLRLRLKELSIRDDYYRRATAMSNDKDVALPPPEEGDCSQFSKSAFLLTSFRSLLGKI